LAFSGAFPLRIAEHGRHYAQAEQEPLEEHLSRTIRRTEREKNKMDLVQYLSLWLVNAISVGFFMLKARKFRNILIEMGFKFYNDYIKRFRRVFFRSF